MPGTAAAAVSVTLPVEVVGENGVTATVSVDIPPRLASEVRALWMQISNLAYPGMISVQINASAWVPLTNDTADVAQPGRSYGGIGGAYSTLRVTLALPGGAVTAGANTLRFRFNQSDGVASGFRVVAFNFLTADSSAVLGSDAFTEEDPGAWRAPLGDSASILAGKELWLKAPLKANSLQNAGQIRAHCADCHAHDGRDLKYFGYSNASIAARSRFHGLSELQGRQIASYIRALDAPSPGRPWNPPYQPGPGLDGRPVAHWAAGAGLSWVLDNDSATFAYMFNVNRGSAVDWSTVASTAVRDAFRPDGNLNPREIPISLQLPDWNHWLPQIHPLDAWGPAFTDSEFAKLYGPSPDSRSGNSRKSLRESLSSPDLSAWIASGRIVESFEKWKSARLDLLKKFVKTKTVWSPDLAQKVYATQLWQLVKTWEMTQEFGLEGRGRELSGASGEPRAWFNTIPAAAAPSTAGIPNGPAGMGGSALTNEYFNASWYALQVLLNSGNHQHRGRLPVDWPYVIGEFQALYQESHRPEPARLLVTVIKAMQSTDPGIGPQDVDQGWRPEQNVDPAILVSPSWAPMFQTLPAEARRVLAESFLAAWLEKNLQYPMTRYFRVGLSESSYRPTAGYAAGYWGEVWDSAPLFIAAGVDAEIVRQLQNWGVAYTDTAGRFQYAPKSRARSTK